MFLSLASFFARATAVWMAAVYQQPMEMEWTRIGGRTVSDFTTIPLDKFQPLIISRVNTRRFRDTDRCVLLKPAKIVFPYQNAIMIYKRRIVERYMDPRDKCIIKSPNAVCCDE
jgi:hypothetical protein